MKKSTSSPKPPKGYTPEARRLWSQVAGGWSLDAPALALLDSACRALMRVRQAQDAIAAEGPFYKDRFNQPKQHPAVLTERDAKQTLLRNLRALNLDLEPLHDRPGRPGGS